MRTSRVKLSLEVEKVRDAELPGGTSLGAKKDPKPIQHSLSPSRHSSRSKDSLHIGNSVRDVFESLFHLFRASAQCRPGCASPSSLELDRSHERLHLPTSPGVAEYVEIDPDAEDEIQALLLFRY